MLSVYFWLILLLVPMRTWRFGLLFLFLFGYSYPFHSFGFYNMLNLPDEGDHVFITVDDSISLFSHSEDKVFSTICFLFRLVRRLRQLTSNKNFKSFLSSSIITFS